LSETGYENAYYYYYCYYYYYYSTAGAGVNVVVVSGLAKWSGGRERSDGI